MPIPAESSLKKTSPAYLEKTKKKIGDQYGSPHGGVQVLLDRRRGSPNRGVAGKQKRVCKWEPKFYLLVGGPSLKPNNLEGAKEGGRGKIGLTLRLITKKGQIMDSRGEWESTVRAMPLAFEKKVSRVCGWVGKRKGLRKEKNRRKRCFVDYEKDVERGHHSKANQKKQEKTARRMKKGEWLPRREKPLPTLQGLGGGGVLFGGDIQGLCTGGSSS